MSWTLRRQTNRVRLMNSHPAHIRTADGANLFLRDWGQGAVMLFVSAWGFSSQTWSQQTVPLVARGWRCVAFDRRGHGRSDDRAFGPDFDRLADDLGEVIEQLDLHAITLVAHSLGAAEAVRYLTRHGASRVRALVLVAPCTPCLEQRPDNSDGVPPAIFDAMRADMARDFPQWLDDNEAGFFLNDTSVGTRRWVKDTMMQASLQALLQSHRVMTATDMRSELVQLSLPTLVVHGDADHSMPLQLTGRPTAALIQGSRLSVYEGAPHGLTITHSERLNADIEQFALQSAK
jgi:non-heme chloroperoxidase